MTRPLQAWILLVSFSLAGMQSVGCLAVRPGVRRCCASEGCCASGHCSMGGAASAMPANCPMAKPTRSGRYSFTCTCMVSQRPALAVTEGHNILAFDPADYGTLSKPLSAFPFHFFLVANALDGHPAPLTHPPKRAS